MSRLLIPALEHHLSFNPSGEISLDRNVALEEPDLLGGDLEIRRLLLLDRPAAGYANSRKVGGA